MSKPRSSMGISRDALISMLDYDPKTGVFRWRSRPVDTFVTKRTGYTWNGRFAGKEAGGIYKNGYRYICINYVDYKASRLAWLIMTGEEPGDCVDHKDLVQTNDAWLNLRLATKSENGANRTKQRNNTSGFKGVFWSSQQSCWAAQICCKGKRRHLGCFDTPEAASEAYAFAAKEAFGEFARAA